MHPSTAPAEPTAVQNTPQGTSSPGRSGYSASTAAGKASFGGLARRANAPGPKRAGLGAKGAMEHPNTEVVVLPPAGREEQFELWGLSPDRLGDHLFTGDSRGHAPDDGVDVGGASEDDREDSERELEERGYLIEGGWSPVAIKNNRLYSGGLTGHRGVLHPDEYVDQAALRAQVERELGFSYEQIRSVYRQGPLTADQRELRGCIDARLLALSCAGGNMAELGRALGFPIRPKEGDCQVIKRALERARKEEQ